MTHAAKIGIEVDMADFLSLERLEVGSKVTSKKRLMEVMATLMLEGNPDLDRRAVLHSLNERERLGSTGVGNGVALPHGRLAGIDDVVGAAAILDKPIEYDAIDQLPVQLVFALLVPVEATDQHLKILAHLAQLFSDKEFRNRLLNAESKETAFQLLTAGG